MLEVLRLTIEHSRNKCFRRNLAKRLETDGEILKECWVKFLEDLGKILSPEHR